MHELFNHPVYMAIGLSGLWTWVQEQGQYLLYIGVIYLAGKEYLARKLGKMAISIVSGAVLAFVINNPGGVLTPLGNLAKKVLGL